MTYQPKNYERLIGTKGFSENLLRNHFKLYEGYVKNTNKIAEQFTKSAKKNESLSAEGAELKRRFGWEFNGMRLHEVYFDNLTKDGSEYPKESEFAAQINDVFGSYSNWADEFKSTGGMRGIGWVALYFDPASGNLFNTWIDEHNTGHLADAKLLLIMDVFEHAFITDYGLKKKDYISAFFDALDWNIVEERYRSAKSTQLSAANA